MLGLRFCPRGRLLVVLAVIAVAAIALVPRGLVRATAASQLTDVSATAEAVVQPPGSDVLLPGVRALVAREEQDAADLVIRLITSSPANDVTAADDEAPTWRLPDEELPRPACAAPPLACGQRAPPRPI